MLGHLVTIVELANWLHSIRQIFLSHVQVLFLIHLFQILDHALGLIHCLHLHQKMLAIGGGDWTLRVLINLKNTECQHVVLSRAWTPRPGSHAR